MAKFLFCIFWFSKFWKESGMITVTHLNITSISRIYSPPSFIKDSIYI
jgi:hypothetical protein